MRFYIKTDKTISRVRLKKNKKAIQVKRKKALCQKYVLREDLKDDSDSASLMFSDRSFQSHGGPDSKLSSFKPGL